MEEEFIVQSRSEGTAISTTEIESILSTMGCQGFNERYLGTVKAVVEKSGGRITKQKLVWGEENDLKFNSAQQKNADALLAATVKAVEGGGDPGDVTIKFIIKK